ncbi:MAG: biotin synthase BioB [Victivallaceae bacterium]|nr:biotin synthase BioB [Victivallaceae bacterium]
MLMHGIEEAYKVLDGKNLTYDEALALADEVHGADLLDLISLANKVREKFAPQITPCSILNAKSGLCAQNCRFCAQSGFHHTGIENYDLLPLETVLADAGVAAHNRVRAFGYVTSGRGYSDPADPEFVRMLEAFDAIAEAYPELKLCVSIGILSESCAKALSEHHVWRYNMNLQTSPARYGELVATTHTIEEKIATIRYLQKYHVTICCGGIIGLGESWRDRIDMAFALREIDPEGIPLNVLLPIAGTPLEKQPILEPCDVAKTFALFRLIHPSRMIKFAAGRETVMKDFQGLLMLSGLNSMITGGYLTTRGRSVEDDKAFIGHLEKF